jgi:hypothetical protein
MNVQIDTPLWLLLPALLLFWHRRTEAQTLPGQWQRMLDAPMQSYLRRFAVGPAHDPHRWLWLLALAALGAALATIRVGETPSAPPRDLHARVLLLDLSDAEAAQEAVFRARALAQRAGTIPTAIVASGADAYDVVPITGDPAPLTRYLDVLVPDMLPGEGQAPEAGLRRALAMFDRAGSVARQIVLFGGRAPPPDATREVPGQDVLVIVAPADDTAGWRAWAPDATVVPTGADDDLDARLGGERERAQRRIKRDGIDLTPLFIAAAMVAWLLLFARRER